MIDTSLLNSRIIEGDKAELVKEYLTNAFDAFEKSCYDRFKKVEIKNYQEVDNSCIIMLKLEMKVIDNLKSELFNAILSGNEARKKIKEGNNQ